MTSISRVLALVLSLPLLLAARPVPDAASSLSEARALLTASKADEALAKAEEGLEYTPSSFELLEIASRAAQAAGEKDKALWYALLALDAVPANASKEVAKVRDELAAALATIDPLQGKATSARDAYNQALFTLGADAAKRKAWVCAASLLGRARGEAAAKALAKIYDDKKAVEALLESGANVELRTKKKRTAKEIAKLDAAHATWDKAHEIKGAQYTVRTNMGIEFAESVSSAMEQMNRYYRRVFGVKERGGETARVTLKIYRSRADFDAHEKEMKDGKEVPLGPTTKGFYSASASEVCTYDPREEGFSLADLWGTLFHEASHQFTHLALPAKAEPIWLNEGTASYFEGARLLPNGAIEANLVAEGRLEQVVASIESQALSLTQVITCPDGDTYDATYYPYGWGLVYFFHNYEDDASKRVYLQPYRDYLLSYKSGAKHDIKARFVEYFVTKPKLPGVATFDDFEKRWNAWIKDLGRLHFGGPEVADELIERARKQKANGAADAALESYAWALRKRAGDPVALHERAEILATQKKNDAAAWTFRVAYEALRAVEDVEAKLPGAGELSAKDLTDASLARLAKLDKALHDGLLAADATFETALVESAKAYADAELPLSALAFLDASRTTLGGSAKIAEAREEILAASKVDPRRWLRLSLAKELDTWSGSDVFSSDGQAISAQSDGVRFLYSLEPVPATYRYEAVLDVSNYGEDGFAGLVFGSGDAGLRFFGLLAGGAPSLGELDEGLKLKKQFKPVKGLDPSNVTLAIEVREAEVEMYVDGKSVGKAPFEPEKLAGGIGLIVQGGATKFSAIRIRS